MKYTNKDIILDSDARLRQKAESYKFPLSKEEKNQLRGLLEYVKLSLDDTIAKKMDLSPAVGLAATQVGLMKRAFSAYIEENDEVILEQIFINPKIIAHSTELTYVDNGEACLSVKQEHEGIVPRYSTIKVHYFDLDAKPHTKVFVDFEAIVIQHEIDHLNGILFYDHINKLFPYKIPNNSHPL